MIRHSPYRCETDQLGNVWFELDERAEREYETRCEGCSRRGVAWVPSCTGDRWLCRDCGRRESNG